MPKELHNKLMKSAKKIGLKGKAEDAYVYGTLAKLEKPKKIGKYKKKKDNGKSKKMNY